MDNEEIKARLLFSLARKRKWGASHTAYENLFKAFKSEALGKDMMRSAKEITEELFKEGYIIKKPTQYGLQVSLNHRMSREIKDLIRKKLGFDL